MRPVIFITFLLLLSPFSTLPTSGEIIPSQDLPGPELSRLSNDTNLHFSGKYCRECHEERGSRISGALRYGGDFNRLCWCHEYSTQSYIHPVNLKPSEPKKSRIPGNFPLTDGMLSCGTCHEISQQCEKPDFRPINNNFLREGPYTKRTGICYKCHEEKNYEKLDPHDQLDARGRIIEEKCLYCHTKKPDEKTATYETIALVGDIKIVCQRCHNILEKHPAGKEHFIRPGRNMLLAMKSAEIIYETILPLDNKGEITCITCHNPHERGVIPLDREASSGASLKFRHRIEGIVCNACHDFYGM